jgi:hypothetical protein
MVLGSEYGFKHIMIITRHLRMFFRDVEPAFLGQANGNTVL